MASGVKLFVSAFSAFVRCTSTESLPKIIINVKYETAGATMANLYQPFSFGRRSISRATSLQRAVHRTLGQSSFNTSKNSYSIRGERDNTGRDVVETGCRRLGKKERKSRRHSRDTASSREIINSAT